MVDLRRASSTLFQLTLARAREFVREPEAMFWVLVFPSLLAGVLGLAFRSGPSETQTVAVTTAALVQSLEREPLIEPKLMSPPEAMAALKNGRVVLVVEPSADGGLTFSYDAGNESARAARRLADSAAQRAAGQTDPLPVHDIARSTPGSRYIDFLTPGLLGMTLMSSAIWGMGYPIAEARRGGLLKRFVATPMPRSLYLLSYVLHNLAVTVVESCVILAFGALAFGAPQNGSVLALAVLCGLVSLAFSGLGLLLVSRVRTPEGAAGLMNVAMTPMLIASGVFFPAQKFPDWAKPALDALPLTASVDALRSVMLRGASLADCAQDLAILSAWGLAGLGLGAWLFRWR